MIRKIIGSTLCACGNIPKFKITYQLKGITLVERHCENCIEKVKETEQESKTLLNLEYIAKLL